MEFYKYVIIGGGISGYTLALDLSFAGEEVCLIEKGELGGTCLNQGCILSKMLLHYSVTEKNIFNLFEKCFETIKCLRKGVGQRISSAKINHFNDEATILEGKRIFLKKKNEEIKFEKLIVATGAKTNIPLLFNYVKNCVCMENIWKYFLQSKPLPESIVIIGGGYIGIEFAFIFSQLGIEVILIEAEERILTTLSQDLSVIIKEELNQKGVKIITNAVVKDIKEQVLTLTDGQEFLYDYLFLATGRKANEPESSLFFKRDFKQNVLVNKFFESSQEDIFFIGDVLGTLQFAYKAESDAKLLAKYFLRGNVLDEIYQAEDNNINIPMIIFSNPNIAVIGEQDPLKYQVIKVPFSLLGKSYCDNSILGFLKLFVDSDGVIVGGQVINKNAQEVLAMLQVIIYLRMTCKKVIKMIFPHPSSSEIIKKAVEIYLQS